MEPPLTRLDWHWWAIFADWCQEYRPKGEAFARKVAKSLRKMEAVGCDPKMLLYSGRRHRWATYLVYSPKQEWTTAFGNHFFYAGPKAGVRHPVTQQTLYWIADRNYGKETGSPADLPKPLQDTRLAWKFWKCVNRRALGIRDDVLE